MFHVMPVQGSSWAAEVDWINAFITGIAIFCTLAVTGVTIFFAIKYRKKSPNQQTAYITHNTSLEIMWTAIPTVIVLFTFYFGFVTYSDMRTPPANALDINVDAFSWRWEFEHSNGKKATNELVVPLGRAVRLIMTSHDVLHSFFIPAMRVKEDVRGEVYSYLWFTPIQLGTFPIFCAEYCGENHSQMRATLRVVTEEEYQDYIYGRGTSDLPEQPPAEAGKELFTLKGCVACHTIDGTPRIGPTLKGLFIGGLVALEDGSSVTIDENYLRESLVQPKAKIVKGFASAAPMPSFEGQLNEKEIASLIAYLKTL